MKIAPLKIPRRERSLSVEHPTGEFTVTLTVGGAAERPVIERAGLLRTARILMEGQAFVPARVLAADSGARQAAE